MLVSGLLQIVHISAIRGQEALSAPLSFEEHVRPILKAHCFECHGDSAKPKAGLDVRLARLLVQGGETGPAVVPGRAKESLLLDKIVSQAMPPGKKKLLAKDVAVIRRWIEQGARTTRAEPEKLAPGFFISSEEEEFWSFQPIQTPVAPTVKNQQRVRTPIDAFVLARLEAKGLSFAPEADRRVLVRRAYFDLIGLPPSPKEVEDFLADASPSAYEKVLDRLLESPHYGERWGRHWLDIAGYADSEGATGEDPGRKSAWKYRDYVIRAFNKDLPWDQFVREQLAGDELASPPFDKVNSTDQDRMEKLIATGFLRMAPDGTASKGADIPTEANQTIADTLQIVSTAFLGLTIHCAQCHNHKYDPIPQTDYFKLRAIFEPAFNWKTWRRPLAREVAVLDADKLKKAEELEAAAKKLEQERGKRLKQMLAERFEKEIVNAPAEAEPKLREIFFKRPSDRKGEETQYLQKYPTIAKIQQQVAVEFAAKYAAEAKELLSLRAQKPAPESIRALTEIPGKVPPTHLFDRGDFLAPREVIAPGTLSVLARHGLNEVPEKNPKLATTGRRLAFADWLTHPRNPLTARVLVNRIWMNHFGTGLVSNPADFGTLGEKPVHPELLDWLAHDFQAGGWKLKRLHKTIMMSTVYRQVSVRTAALNRLDPDNKLLGRMSVRRLEAEIVRDALLAVSGKLNPKQFGQPIPVTVDDQGEVVVGVDTRDGVGRPSGRIVPLHGEECRRSVYIMVKRTSPLGILETFDGPMVTPSCGSRTPTTVATQALLLMNNRDVMLQAGAFADRIEREAGRATTAQIRLAWSYALAQSPAPEDLEAGETFLAAQQKVYDERKRLPGGQTAAQLALANYCHALICSNGFLYVE